MSPPTGNFNTSATYRQKILQLQVFVCIFLRFYISDVYLLHKIKWLLKLLGQTNFQWILNTSIEMDIQLQRQNLDNFHYYFPHIVFFWPLLSSPSLPPQLFFPPLNK